MIFLEINEKNAIYLQWDKHSKSHKELDMTERLHSGIQYLF